MTRLEFSYSSLIADQNGEEVEDTGMISFNLDFAEDPQNRDYKRVCYAVALEEVTSILADKYGDDVYDSMPDISIKISGLTITS